MQLWSKEHALTLIPAMILMVLAGFAARRWLGGKPKETRMIPLQIIAILLLLLEVGKQVVSL